MDVKKTKIKNGIIIFLAIIATLVAVIGYLGIEALVIYPDSRSDLNLLIRTIVSWSGLVGLLILIYKLDKKWNLG